jgi:hypothetical protein
MSFNDEPDSASIGPIKMSKEGHLMVIPVVKQSLFGSAEFGNIEFVVLDTT